MWRAVGDGRALEPEDLLTELEQSPPLAVTMREHITEMRTWAEGRCVRA
jgi:hypothetical protein